MKTEYRVIVIIVSGIALLVLGAGALKKNDPALLKPGTNIFFLTQPVKTFSGVIEKIEGDSVTVSQNMTNGSVTQNISYRVITDKNTVIEQPESPVPYLFAKTADAIKKKKTIKDLKVGRAAVVNTDEDLRALTSPEFRATRITLGSIANTLSGKVFDVNGNTLIIRAIPSSSPGSDSPKEKNFRVKITDNTEISRSAADGTPVRLTLDDLKRNIWVIVYTDGDLNSGTEFTALRVDPSVTVEVPTPTPTARPSITSIPPQTISPATGSSVIKE
jgi:hypothetical protein